MINQTVPTHISMHKHTPFGIRLRTTREALGLDRKEIAAQLRLHESVIIMIENGEFKTDLPLTFIRGYIRNYSKLLEIPDQELQNALALLQPKPEVDENEVSTAPASSSIASKKFTMPINIGHYFMQIFTYLLAITVIGLVGIWWHSHKTTTTQEIVLPKAIPVQSTETSSTKNSDSAVNTAPNVEATGDTNDMTSPHAEDITAQATTTTIPIEPQKNSHLQVPALNKFSHFFHPENKVLLTQFVMGNEYLQPLIELILLLIILTVSMRKYASHAIATPMAGTRLVRKPRKSKLNFRFSKTFSIPDWFKDHQSLLLLSMVLLISLFGLGSLWWNKHTKKVSVTQTVVSKPVVAQNQNTEPTIPWDTDLSLLPPPNLNATLLANTYINALQALGIQLDDYASQAAATLFALTDPSTPIGQFTYKKKKIRRHRPAYYYHSNNYDNNNSQASAPNGPFTY